MRAVSRVSRAAGVALLAGVLAAPAWAQPPTLVEVLRRATDYVETLHAQLSGIVAEERYEQEEVGGGQRRRRRLQSDFLLIQPEGAERYYGFRDVFEADGRAVRDRGERLARLFLDPTATSDRQIERIRAESALYNIGGVQRNFNPPTYALLFLRASHKSRFSFERVDERSLPLGLDGPDDDARLWVLAYRETWPTTAIRGADGRNMPAAGRFWVEPDTGRVLATELTVNDPALRATIAVRFETSAEVGHLVPVEMRERYDNRRTVSRVEGTAVYGRFRQFQVEVTESRE